jgi:hypothetical protein
MIEPVASREARRVTSMTAAAVLVTGVAACSTELRAGAARRAIRPIVAAGAPPAATRTVGAAAFPAVSARGVATTFGAGWLAPPCGGVGAGTGAGDGASGTELVAAATTSVAVLSAVALTYGSP